MVLRFDGAAVRGVSIGLRSPSRSTVIHVFMHWQATRTASTGKKRSPALISVRTRSRARGRTDFDPRKCSRTTTRIPCSPLSGTRSLPARRTRMSTIFEPFSSKTVLTLPAGACWHELKWGPLLRSQRSAADPIPQARIPPRDQWRSWRPDRPCGGPWRKVPLRRRYTSWFPRLDR